jgi:hypothetical protein
MILQLAPSVPVFIVENAAGIPIGSGLAIFLLDESREHHTLWCVAYDNGGSVWWVPQPFVRLQVNPSAGRHLPRGTPCEPTAVVPDVDRPHSTTWP